MATTRRKTTRTKKAEESQAKAILESVKNLKPEDVITDIGNLQVGLQGTLAGLSAEISSKIEQMQNVDEAISLKEAELKTLYDIESEAVSIEQIKVNREEEDKLSEARRKERQAQWEEESKERDQKWIREVEEHQYRTKLNQRNTRDAFRNELEETRKEEALRKETLEKDWAEREQHLTSREDELSELREKVQGIDANIKSAVSKAEAVLNNRLKKDFEHQIQLVEMDANSKLALSKASEDSMRSTISSLSAQIKDLQDKLDAARHDAKEVTNQALQSASGRQVAQALQRVVDQGSNNSKTK